MLLICTGGNYTFKFPQTTEPMLLLVYCDAFMSNSDSDALLTEHRQGCIGFQEHLLQTLACSSSNTDFLPFRVC